MRKLAAITAAATLAILISLAGCAQGQGQSPLPLGGGESLDAVVTGAQKTLLQGSEADDGVSGKPVAVGLRELRVDGQHDSIIYSDLAVDAVRAYLNGITVGGESDTGYEDADYAYCFYYPDGHEVAFSFEPGQIMIDGQYRRIEGDGKLNVVFAGNDTELGSCPPTPDMHRFFAVLEGEMPVQIDIGNADGTRTVVSLDEIEDTCEMLADLRLCNGYDPEQFADQQAGLDLAPSSYTCTFADGYSYTFHFVGNYLSVEFPDQLGTWGFYTDFRQ